MRSTPHRFSGQQTGSMPSLRKCIPWAIIASKLPILKIQRFNRCTRRPHRSFPPSCLCCWASVFGGNKQALRASGDMWHQSQRALDWLIRVCRQHASARPVRSRSCPFEMDMLRLLIIRNEKTQLRMLDCDTFGPPHAHLERYRFSQHELCEFVAAARPKVS